MKKNIRWIERDTDVFAYRGEICLAYIKKTNGHYLIEIILSATIPKDKHHQWVDTLEEAQHIVEELFDQVKDDDD